MFAIYTRDLSESHSRREVLLFFLFFLFFGKTHAFSKTTSSFLLNTWIIIYLLDVLFRIQLLGMCACLQACLCACEFVFVSVYMFTMYLFCLCSLFYRLLLGLHALSKRWPLGASMFRSAAPVLCTNVCDRNELARARVSQRALIY